MKNLYFTTLLFFSVFILSAQIVNIPDPNFKSALISQGVDTNSDGEIQISEAEESHFSRHTNNFFSYIYSSP